MAFDFSKIMEMLNLSTDITYENVLEAHNAKPKRICFKTSHSDSLREINFEDVKWALNLPFEESIKKIFESETGLSIYEKKNGKYWCPIKEEADFEKASNFIAKFETTVFLRDRLDLSISVSEHFDKDENRTEIGELEYQAKYHDCRKSCERLVEIISEFIKHTPFYNNADYICAVPSSNPEKKNLPNLIAERLSEKDGLPNMSKNVCWKNEKKSLKELSFEEKWNELNDTGVKIDGDFKNKSVILLDDLYQSGITIQFVAMKLKDVGIKKVYGLTIVKSRRDTDNQ